MKTGSGAGLKAIGGTLAAGTIPIGWETTHAASGASIVNVRLVPGIA